VSGLRTSNVQPEDMFRYRVGRTLGRTIYQGDQFEGLVESAHLATRIVGLLNADRERTAPPPLPGGEDLTQAILDHIGIDAAEPDDPPEAVVARERTERATLDKSATCICAPDCQEEACPLHGRDLAEVVGLYRRYERESFERGDRIEALETKLEHISDDNDHHAAFLDDLRKLAAAVLPRRLPAHDSEAEEALRENLACLDRLCAGHLPADPCASDTRPRLHGDHGPYLEDMALARAVARRLAPHAAAMTDAQLDADPMVGWVSCLFRRVRDENGERDGQPERDAGANRGDGGESPGGGRPGPGDDRAGGAGAEGASARTASSGVGPRTSDDQPRGSKVSVERRRAKQRSEAARPGGERGEEYRTREHALLRAARRCVAAFEEGMHDNDASTALASAVESYRGGLPRAVTEPVDPLRDDVHGGTAEAPSVWHHMPAPGVAGCGVDYPGMSKSVNLNRVTCVACLRGLAREKVSSSSIDTTAAGTVAAAKEAAKATYQAAERRSEAASPGVTHDVKEAIRRYDVIADKALEDVVSHMREHRDWALDPGRMTDEEAKAVEGALDAMIQFANQRRRGPILPLDPDDDDVQSAYDRGVGDERRRVHACTHAWRTSESNDNEMLVKCRRCGIEQTHAAPVPEEPRSAEASPAIVPGWPPCPECKGSKRRMAHWGWIQCDICQGMGLSRERAIPGIPVDGDAWRQAVQRTKEQSCANAPSGGITPVEPKGPVKVAELKRSPVVPAASPAESSSLADVTGPLRPNNLPEAGPNASEAREDSPMQYVRASFVDHGPRTITLADLNEAMCETVIRYHIDDPRLVVIDEVMTSLGHRALGKAALSVSQEGSKR